MRFQQNLAARRAEHCTAESSCAVSVKNEDDSGRAAARPPVSGRAAPRDRASGARNVADNSSRVGVTSCREATVAVRFRESTP
jgi:hypothetical protein